MVTAVSGAGSVGSAHTARSGASTVLAGPNPRHVNNGDSVRNEQLSGAGGFLEFRSWVPVGEPFADYLNLSFDKELESLVVDEAMPFVDLLGCSADAKVPGLFRGRSGGAVKFGRRGRVATVSLSGQVLGDLRQQRLFEGYLVAMGAFPHRVTMLHATQDFLVPDPPAAYELVKRLAYAGQLQLTRKWIGPETVRLASGLAREGVETGTVYMGRRQNADVWAKVYDKRQERVDKGYADPGPLMRVEIALMSDVGCSLRDAAVPGPVFWHHCERLLRFRPPGVAAWCRGGDGFVLGEVRRVITRGERVSGLLSGSPDVQRLFDLARAEVGERGLDVASAEGQAAVVEWLLPFLRKRARLMGQMGDAARPGCPDIAGGEP